MRPLIALSALALLAHCGDEPDLCKSPGVTWTEQLMPQVVQPYCSSCHDSSLAGRARSGAPAGLDFDLWPPVLTNASAVANAITSGTMPPAGRPKPSAPERELAKAWRRCGFPQ